MNNPHILVIPYPAPSHIISLLKLSEQLTKHGLRITFVNSEYNHKKILNASALEGVFGDQIRLVLIPDDLPDEERTVPGKSLEAVLRVMPGKVEELIQQIDGSESKITCVLVDQSITWMLGVAEKHGVKRAAFCPAAAGTFALGSSIPKLISDGIINENGTLLKHEMIQLSPDTPPINPSEFVWLCFEDFNTQKIVFDVMLRNNRAADKTEWLLCNTTHDLEAGAFSLLPNVLPIGPLSAYEELGNIAVNFWQEDTTCMQWLDQQPPRSVIYMAFGSFTVVDQTQFRELALGLELTNRPFLWVVRPDIMKREGEQYPEGFQDRVANRGRIVGWAPQRAVLSHPSIACFVSHCGWNSTIEGVSNGIPFLCWPYFADQFLNENYICESWKVGLKLEKDDSGIISGEEIKSKVDKLLGDESLKARALELKKKTTNSIKEGGSSDKNLKSFIKWVK